MKKDHTIIEKETLTKGALLVGLMGLAGVSAGILGGSGAVILDGMFSTVLCITVLLATKVEKKTNQPKSYMYPDSYVMLENIYLLFKLVVLMAILVYSFINGLSELIRHFMGTLEHREVDQQIINLYYISKTILVIISFMMYKQAIKDVNGKSEILKIEQKSVLIDGVITFTIAIGFIVFSRFEATKEISDPIILVGLSVFLMREIAHDLSKEFQKILGKRMYIKQEEKYLKIFNLMFSNYSFKDIYIKKIGKETIVSIVVTYDGSRTNQEIWILEKSIKGLMKADFDKIIIYTYWAEKIIK